MSYETLSQMSTLLIIQMFHDNRTTPPKENARVPLTGFTHTYTPNDFEVIDDEIMEQLGK